MGKVHRNKMDLAIDAYIKGEMSIREAAKAFDVAKSSLSNRLLGTVKLNRTVFRWSMNLFIYIQNIIK